MSASLSVRAFAFVAYILFRSLNNYKKTVLENAWWVDSLDNGKINR